MPKAWEVKQLRPDMPLSQAAALILQVKLPEVLHYERGTVRGGMNAVHDMRVGSKRLREAVRVLKPALPATARARVLPLVEQLNDLLGEVRDRDVLRDEFVKLGKQAPSAAVPTALLRQLKAERRQHHAVLVEFLENLRGSDFAATYERLMKRMLKAKSEQVTVLAFADEAVGERLQSVVDNMQVVYKPSSVTAFHRQRIRVKKLKYALEPFLTILPNTVAPVYDQIADLQELMGQVHDVDVQLALLEEWWADHEEAAEALDAATAALQQRRAELLQATVKHAKKMRRAKFEATLREVLGAGLSS
jgi:CHAD domain-containing protein